jgi:hypothetical protein
MTVQRNTPGNIKMMSDSQSQRLNRGRDMTATAGSDGTENPFRIEA